MYQRIPILAPVDKPRLTRVAEPAYDPTGQRPCSACGSRTNWRRLEVEPVGGWVCCLPDALLSAHPEMRHQCNALCGLDGAA